MDRKSDRVATLVLMIAIVVLVVGGGILGAGWGAFEGFPIVRVKVDGVQVSGDVPAVNFFGRTMVPVRFVAEALGAKVFWNQTTQVVSMWGTTDGSLPSSPDLLEGIPRVGPNWLPTEEQLLVALKYGQNLAGTPATGQYPSLRKYGLEPSFMDEVLEPYMAFLPENTASYALLATQTSEALRRGYEAGREGRSVNESDAQHVIEKFQHFDYCGAERHRFNVAIEVYLETDPSEIDRFYDDLGLSFEVWGGALEGYPQEKAHMQYYCALSGLPHFEDTSLAKTYRIHQTIYLTLDGTDSTALKNFTVDLSKPLYLYVRSSTGSLWILKWESLQDLK